ncbi:hypothetical protein MC885_010763 [Smutsia gigantea]|nr:hypothetical protein MC885_010763 [Smutsia gigantea]
MGRGVGFAAELSEVEVAACAGRARSLVLQTHPLGRAEGTAGKRREPLSLLRSRLSPWKVLWCIASQQWLLGGTSLRKMANMDSNSGHLLIPEVDLEINPGPMNIQYDSSDLRSKRVPKPTKLDKKLFSSVADFQNFWLNILCQVYIPFSRPFYIEPTNIVNVNDVIQRVSDHAAAMNKRIHYYSRLSAPADKALIAPDHVLPAPDECYVYSPLGSAYKLKSYTEGYGKNTSLFYDLEYHDGNIYTKYSLGHKTGWIYNWNMCHRADGLFNTLLLLQSTSVDTTTWEYPDVCRYYFGSFGQWSSLLFSLVSLIGAMIVYWVLMSNFLFNTGKFIFNFIHQINETNTILSTNDSNPVICPSAGAGGHPDNGSVIFSANDTGLQQFGKWWNKSNTVPFYLIVFLLPLLNFKSPSFFSKFNILGTVSVLYLIFLVTLKAIRLGFHLEFHWYMPTEFFVPVITGQFLESHPNLEDLGHNKSNMKQ